MSQNWYEFVKVEGKIMILVHFNGDRNHLQLEFVVQIHFTVKMGSLQQHVHLETKQHVASLLLCSWFMFVLIHAR